MYFEKKIPIYAIQKEHLKLTIMKENYYYLVSILMGKYGISNVAIKFNCEMNEEKIESAIKKWAKIFIGKNVEILRMSKTDEQTYNDITTKINWGE